MCLWDDLLFLVLSEFLHLFSFSMAAEDRGEDQDAFDVLPTAGDTGIWNMISKKCNILIKK
jgi:hypothetical protein